MNHDREKCQLTFCAKKSLIFLNSVYFTFMSVEKVQNMEDLECVQFGTKTT